MPQAVPVLLLHCYPYHRQAGYLAQAFDQVNFDVGLAINYLGARSTALVGEALDTAPFTKQLFSSDAFGPPELHLLGSVLWRRAMGLVLGDWVRTGDCAEADAIRIVDMIGSDNAVRVQIWSAISTYLLVAILKKTLKLEPSLHEILQVLSVTPFEKVPVAELFASRTIHLDTRDFTDDIPNLFE